MYNQLRLKIKSIRRKLNIIKLIFLKKGTPPTDDEVEGEYPTVITQGAHNTLIVQALAFGKYLGILQVDFDASGEVSSWSGNPILLDGSVAEGLLCTYLKNLH